MSTDEQMMKSMNAAMTAVFGAVTVVTPPPVKFKRPALHTLETEVEVLGGVFDATVEYSIARDEDPYIESVKLAGVQIDSDHLPGDVLDDLIQECIEASGADYVGGL